VPGYPYVLFVNISTVLKTNKRCGRRPPAGIQRVAIQFNRTRTVPLKKLLLMKHSASFDVCIDEGNANLIVEIFEKNMSTFTKLPPLVEDLRNHSQEQLAELRHLLCHNAPSHPDPRRPGFFEVSGPDSVYYVFKYPTGTKVLLIAVWERDHVAELAALACTAAA
jgi:hypothetical protein